MKNELNWPLIITAIVAVYGAILSTVNLITNIRNEQPRLSVVLKSGNLEGSYLRFGPSSASSMLFIVIANVGSKVVTIQVINIKVTKGSFLPIWNIINPRGISLPYTLEESQNCIAGVDIKELSKKLIQSGCSKIIKLHAIVVSGTGKIYKSKKSWILNLDEYNKQ
jgi:hypothetical protein